jgi:transcriptional/translational regulatory protein YebC/TACO1
MGKLNFNIDQISTLKKDNENPIVGSVTNNIQLHLAQDWIEMNNRLNMICMTAVDYDGNREAKDLMKLVDELTDIAANGYEIE